MDNNSADKTPGMGSAEETEILYTIENYIRVSAIYTTVDMETTRGRRQYSSACRNNRSGHIDHRSARNITQRQE